MDEDKRRRRGVWGSDWDRSNVARIAWSSEYLRFGSCRISPVEWLRGRGRVCTKQIGTLHRFNATLNTPVPDSWFLYFDVSTFVTTTMSGSYMSIYYHIYMYIFPLSICTLCICQTLELYILAILSNISFGSPDWRSTVKEIYFNYCVCMIFYPMSKYIPTWDQRVTCLFHLMRLVQFIHKFVCLLLGPSWISMLCSNDHCLHCS